MPKQGDRPVRAARVYLDVPYPEKDAAKAAGARWDPVARRWYDPRPPTAALRRWAALPDVPDLLPGEDRGFGAGLFVDLVPASFETLKEARDRALAQVYPEPRRQLHAGDVRRRGDWGGTHDLAIPKHRELLGAARITR